MSKRISRTRLNASLLCAAGLLFSAPPAAAQQEKIVVLEHADSLIGMVIGGEQAQQLIGHVRFRQDSVVVSCVKAVRYFQSNRYTFEGEADLWDGSMHMVTERGVYDGNTRIAEGFERVLVEDSGTTVRSSYAKYFADEKKAYFTTNVSVEDTASILTCNELTYYREEQHSIAVGNVRIVNARNGLTMYGEHFENFRRRKFSRMTEHPLLVQAAASGNAPRDTLVVRSGSMEAYQDSAERLVAVDSVTITRGAMAAEAGSCVFYPGLDSMILRLSPVIWYASSTFDEHQISGDSVFVRLSNRMLRTAYVRGDAFAISRADSLYRNRFNQMSGQEITLQFEENRIQSIDVDKTATSLYYLFDGGKGNGVNKSTGDHVTVLFEDARIGAIKIIGGTEGQYYPEKMVSGRESDFNLPGFNWRERKPAPAAGRD